VPVTSTAASSTVPLLEERITGGENEEKMSLVYR
jgi:hypothetical protein